MPSSALIVGKSSSCSGYSPGEIQIGYTPLCYFLLGIFEVLLCFGTLATIFDRSCLAARHTQFISINFLLPIYRTVTLIITVCGLFMGIDGIIGIFPVGVNLYLVKWFLLRTVTESLSVFFLHVGVGYKTIRNSVFIGLVWTTCNFLIIVIPYVLNHNLAFTISISIVLFSLILYYFAMVLLPDKLLHRRPAASIFCLTNCFLLCSELVGVLVYITNTDDQSKQCAVELIFSVDEFLQLIIILKAFCDDSLFWQGLYANSKVNLNTPLLGIWTMNSLAVRTVTDSITDLQNRVVKIIPFNFLTVDTSKFFSGGSARVYRGTYLNNEVAIKFLFCLELTPERVIEFCNEATVLNSLQHPNMVTCYGVAVMPPAISLITEYCTFGSLFDFLHTTDLISKDNERNFSALSTSTKNRFQSDSYYDNPDSSNGRMSLRKADTASSDRTSYVVSPMVSLPTEEKGSGSTTTTTIANGKKIEERRRIHEQSSYNSGSSLDASAFPIIGGGGGSDSPGTVKVRSSSADSTALDLIVHQLSLQHSAELSASSRYINRDTIDENGNFNSNNCDEIRGSSVISRSSNVDNNSGVLQSPRISIVYRNTSDRFESSASYVAQGLNDGDSSCDSNSQRSVDIASRLVEAITGNGTASGRGSVRLTLSRTLPENQGMVVQPTGNSKSWFKSAVSVLLSSEMGFGFAPVTTGSVKLKKGARKQPDQEHEESGRSSHRLLSVKHTSVLLMGKLLPMNTRMQMARDCCAGLAFLHSRNFMHCDIKSLNFLVTSDLVIKLADLGEARDVSRANETAKFMPRNINWSSPEILSFSLDNGATLKVDQSADIWSLVMVLSEIFTGEIPYDSQYYRQMDIHAFNAAIKEGHRPKVPPRIMNITWLSKLVQRAWSYEAADRCTAKELAEAFDINFKVLN